LASSIQFTGTAKLIIAGGELTIPNNRTLTGTVDINDNATLMLNNSVIPTLGILGSQSTINFNSAASINLPAKEYGNLIIAQTNGINSKALSGATTVKNSLILNGKLELGSHNLMLSPGATISGESNSNYIVTNGVGNLLMQVNNNNTDVIFPVGIGNKYSP